MKLKVVKTKPAAREKTDMKEDTQKSLKARGNHLVKYAARLFHTHLLNELHESSLPERIKQELAWDISIEAMADESIKLRIENDLAFDLEYGTSEITEFPWMQRAFEKARQQLDSEIGMKATAAGTTSQKSL